MTFMYSVLDRYAGCSLSLSIDAEEVLKHSFWDEMFRFRKSRDENDLKAHDKNEWINTLLENYKKKYQKQETIEQCKFIFKPYLTWKLEQPAKAKDSRLSDFANNPHWVQGDTTLTILSAGNVIGHVISIPYESKNGTEEIDIGVAIVDGFIGLQVTGLAGEKKNPFGAFELERIPLAITYFPLIYLGWSGIPPRFLNFSLAISNKPFPWRRPEKSRRSVLAYTLAHLLGGKDRKKKYRAWRRTDKWRKQRYELVKWSQEANDYIYLGYTMATTGPNVIDVFSNYSKALKISFDFYEKKKEWFNREGFDGDHGSYHNKYLTVHSM